MRAGESGGGRETETKRNSTRYEQLAILGSEKMPFYYDFHFPIFFNFIFMKKEGRENKVI